MKSQQDIQNVNPPINNPHLQKKETINLKTFKLICPKCKGNVTEHHADDVQTWYVCTKNPQHLTTSPIKKELDEIEQFQEYFCANIGKALAEKKTKEAAFKEELEGLALNPQIEQLLLDEVHRTVSSHDDHIIKAIFYAGISAYISPLNVALKCESGSGKTYSTTQTIKFLPPENVLLIGNGIRKTPDGRNFDDIPEPQKPRREYEPDPEVYRQLLKNYEEEKKAYNKLKEESIYEVDLHNKILVFLESVNLETFKMLKPTMSHDDEYINHKYVDDKGKVHTTRLYGFPTAIFNSLDNEYFSEFATRTLTLTPTTTPSKITASMQISNNKSSFPWEYQNITHNKHLIHEYIRQIRDTITKQKLRAVNPFPHIKELFSQNAVRDMRDFNKFLELLPSHAAFKLYQRPIITVENQKYIVATVQDVLDAKTLFDSVSETTKTGTEQRIINFYNQFVKRKVNGATVNTLTDEYNKANREHKTTRTIQRWLNRLAEIEYVDPREGETVGSRAITYYPLKGTTNETGQSDIRQALDNTEMAKELRRFCEKDFELWLNQLQTTQPAIRCEVLSIDGTSREITIEEFKQKVLEIIDLSCRQIENKPNSAPVEQNAPESDDNTKCPVDVKCQIASSEVVQ